MKHEAFNEETRQILAIPHATDSETWKEMAVNSVNKNPNVRALYQSHTDSLERVLKLGVVVLTFLSAGFFSMFSGSWQSIALGIFFLLMDLLFIIPLVSVHTGRFDQRFLWELNLENGSPVTFLDGTDLVDGTVVGVSHRGKAMTININPEGSARVIYDVPVVYVFPPLITRSV